MGRGLKTKIKESIDEILVIKRTLTDSKALLKADFLIHTKQKTFPTQQELAKFLALNNRTPSRWLKNYREKGLVDFLGPELRPNSKTRKINKEQIHAIKDRHTVKPFTSYKEAYQWVLSEFRLEISETSIWLIMTKKLGIKLKSSRGGRYKQKP